MIQSTNNNIHRSIKKIHILSFYDTKSDTKIDSSLLYYVLVNEKILDEQLPREDEKYMYLYSLY